MSWIESHQEVSTHPKTRKLARLLEIPIPQAVGHLHILWHWALSFADDGWMSEFDPDDIAVGAMWDGDSDTFLKALIDARYVDETPTGRYLHNWHLYAGRLIDKRRRDADRKAESRGQKPEVRAASAGHPRDGAGTVPNLTVPTEPEPKDDGFSEFWDAYPLRKNTSGGTKGSKRAAAKQWAALTDYDRAAALTSLPLYAAIKGNYVRDAERYLRHREWEGLDANAVVPAGNGVYRNEDEWSPEERGIA